jgi:uncharacterized protein YdhG (YjbR/CyaY superfamily)
MNNNQNVPANVDEYLADFEGEVLQKLQQLRQLIKTVAPEAQELISYQMPAYKYHGALVYFAGYQKHVGFYAMPSGHLAFEAELSKYKRGKGSVQFPLGEPLPAKLISQIVQYRLAENLAKVGKK